MIVPPRRGIIDPRRRRVHSFLDGGLSGFWAGGDASFGPPSLAFIGFTGTGTNSTTYNFNGFNIGTPASDRLVVVLATGEGSTNGRRVNSVTIGGQAATEHVDITGAEDSAGALYSRLHTSDTTTTISVTFSGSMRAAGIAVWNINGLQSTTPTDTAIVTGTSQSVQLDVLQDGVIIAFISQENDSGGVTITSTGLTTVLNSQMPPSGEEGDYRMVGAGGSLLSAQVNKTITGSWNSSGILGAVSWR